MVVKIGRPDFATEAMGINEGDTYLLLRPMETWTRFHSKEELITELDKELDTIPGVGRRGAEELLAEIGTDMSRFPTAAHLASWARVCPGTDESAGKRRRVGTGRGNPWLRRMLVEAARAAARTRRTYLSARYRRLAARRGANRAAMAVGHTIAVIAYHLIRDETTYQDLGPNYFDERDREAIVRRSVRRLRHPCHSHRYHP